MKSKKILILGCNGFLGSKLSFFLVKQKYQLIGIGRSKQTFFDSNFSYIKSSLQDTQKIFDELKNETIDTIIITASNLVPSSGHEEFVKEVNQIIYPTIELLKLLSVRNKKICVILISSAGTLYRDSSKKISETSQIHPTTYYGYSKQIFESELIKIANKLKFNYLILRASNIFGNDITKKHDQGIVEIFSRLIKEEKEISIFGNGNIKRDYIYIEDFCIVLDKLLKKRALNKIINVASGFSLSINAVIKLIEQAYNKKAIKNSVQVAEGIKKDIVIDNSLLKKITGHKFMNLKDVLIKFIAENPDL